MNLPIRCLVVDDEELARTLLQHYIEQTPNLHLAGTCANAMDAVAALHQQPVDLLFLDIQMPDLTGIDLLKALVQKPVVIFTTAYEQYALEGYELAAADYLLKPFSYERFTQAVAKATAHIKARYQSLLPDDGTNDAGTVPRDHLLVKAEHRTRRIRFDDILYIQGMREYVSFYLTSGRLMALLSLKHLEEILPPERFLRIHKSYIVSLKHVEAADEEYLYIGDQKIPIGPNYANLIQKRLL
ncbi:MAG: LytTR family DNA-binding domain-containing protein [Saprospiraceae bacterium]|nr:LytTR family DNA-binding domain-containing protein [Saprospiraceae bacterium]MDW8228289.1 LytTR family DNA-binding domain-containing protein [Saprospiraceae bacterium]